MFYEGPECPQLCICSEQVLLSLSVFLHALPPVAQQQIVSVQEPKAHAQSFHK